MTKYFSSHYWHKLEREKNYVYVYVYQSYGHTECQDCLLTLRVNPVCYKTSVTQLLHTPKLNGNDFPTTSAETCSIKYLYQW